MKRSAPEHENHERWLVSYADFITLLFAFFVVMFASSQTDKGKAKQVSQAVEKALAEGASFGAIPAVAKILGGTVDDKGQGNAQMKGPGGAQRASKESPPEQVVELIPSLKALSRDLSEEIKQGKIEVSMEPRGLVVSLRQAIFFPSGTDALDPATFVTVEKVASALKAIPNPIRIEGHTDSIPIHTARFQSNWELSSSRSISMLNLLADRYGIAVNRMAVVGYAETMPVDTNETAEGRTRNRRVDIVILNKLALEPKAASKAAATPAEHKKPSAAH